MTDIVARSQLSHSPAFDKAADGSLCRRRGMALFVEALDAAGAQEHQAAWADLAARALERNIFLEPAFALPAARRLAGGAGLRFLLVWERDEILARRRLIALWPIVRSGRGFGASYKAWVHDYCCCGAPLLDSAQAFAALDALVGHLRAARFSPVALLASQLRADGPTVAVLRRFATLNGLTLDLIARYDRAALDAARQGAETAALVSRKKAKELRRQLRRLGDSGPVLFGMAQETAELNRQIESFLALEIKGWKGRDGGAFASRPAHADFLRTMIRAMAEQGKCRIFWLSHAGRVIASNIVLVAGGEAYFWKTAYDEAFALASPGVQLTLNMTDALLREPGLRLIDSCATPDHPMIDRLWRDQAPMVDVMLSLEAGRSFRFRAALWRERLWRRFREMAKAAWTSAGFR